ncbi:MAG: hypothetical protein EP315_00420 [Gammaproteobacteria bacterium]|nr:MAG: hypothetical protein EP315_00420 [Gammaproteobacteria bacterium]
MQHARLRSHALSPSAAQYMSLVFDRMSYFFRYEDIHSFESVIDLDMDNRRGCSNGLIHLSGHDIPVYCFDDELRPLEEIPSSRNVCVVMQNFSYGLICRETRLLNTGDVMVHDVPGCMRQPYLPVSGICLYRSNTTSSLVSAMLLSLTAMGNYIQRINRLSKEGRS